MADPTPTRTEDALVHELRGLRADLREQRASSNAMAMQTAAVGLLMLAAFGGGLFFGHSYFRMPVAQLAAGAKLEPLPEVVIPEAKPTQKPVKTAIAPDTSIDLKFWKVTLPVNDDGIVSGVGDATEETELKGFAMPPYFEVASNSITFMAPTVGARTGGSNYPRAELREMDGQGEEYEWRIADGGHLAATLAINELPKTSDNKPGRIIIGQIHGPDDELCRLYFDDGKLYFMDDKAGEKLEETQFDLVDAAGRTTDIGLGDEFSYSIDVDGKNLIVTATHDGNKYAATDVISPFWTDKDLYFKAGAYVQVGKPGTKAGTVGSGKGKVTFTALTRPTHDVFRKPKPRKKDSDDSNEG